MFVETVMLFGSGPDWDLSRFGAGRGLAVLRGNAPQQLASGLG